MELNERKFPLFGIALNGQPLVIESHGSILLFEGEQTVVAFCRAASKSLSQAVIVEMQGQPALVKHLVAAQKSGGKLVVWNAESLNFEGLHFATIALLIDQLTGTDRITPSGGRLQFPAQLIFENDGVAPQAFNDDRGQAIAIFESEAQLVFVVQALELGTVVRAKISSPAKLMRYLEIWAERNSRAGWVLMQPFMDEDGDLDFAEEWPLGEFIARLRQQAADDAAANN